MAFPVVPIAPGVPAIPRDASAVAAVVELVVADALSLFAGFGAPQWGLFLNGEPVVTADTVVSFEFKQDSSISTFPVEGGGFESYNKVFRPFDVRLRFATGGTAADRQDLLDSVMAAVASLDLMDAVTPEATYSGINPIHWDYRRTSGGAGIIVVDVFCEQVRSTAASQFTAAKSTAAVDSSATTASTATTGSTPFNDRFVGGSIDQPRSPSASPQVNGGTVQPAPAAPGQFDLSQALP